MELCLVGLFFLVRDADDRGNAVGTPCKGQAIIMIICLAFTVIYQYLLNKAFAPLFRVSRSNQSEDYVQESQCQKIWFYNSSPRVEFADFSLSIVSSYHS